MTGAGRGFCAGADLGDLERGATVDGAADGSLRDRPRARTFPLTVRKPLIAAINGAAAGLGLVEALYCDIRFATPEAKLTTAFARRGLVAEYGISWLLPRLVGPSRALDLLLSGRVVRGEEALQLGLVDRLGEPDALVDDAVAYAADLAEHCSPWSMATIKAQVRADLDRSFAAAVAAADELMLCVVRRAGRRGGRAQLPRAPPAGVPRTRPPEGGVMNFEPTDRGKDYVERVTAFMDERIYPAEAVYDAQMHASGDPHFHPPILEELKDEARARGLWNLFHPHPEWGPGLTNAEYAPLAEIMGRSPAPGAGGDELQRARHRQHGGADAASAPTEHKERWLRPLLDGEIRSAFAMTEPARRLLGRDQHRDADRARRRRVRHQRPQVVDVQRPAPQLQGADRDGQDRPGRPAAPAAVDAGRADRHPRRDDRPRPAGLRLPGPRGPRRGPLRGRARAGRARCWPARATAS